MRLTLELPAIIQTARDYLPSDWRIDAFQPAFHDSSLIGRL